MNLHEYQAKELLAKYGVPVCPGRVAETPEQAAEAFRALGVPLAAVKSQIHAGGRGKGKVYEKDLTTLRIDRGVALVRNVEEARSVAAKILGGVLVTKQTGPQGRTVRKVYVEAGCEVDRELYLGCVLDRKAGKPVFMVSRQGGMEIEEVAARDPNAIVKEPLDVGYGLRPFQGRRLAYVLGFGGETLGQFVKMAASLARMVVERDLSLLEINPLVVTKTGNLLALDAKIGVDDRALELQKQSDLEAMRDVHEEDPVEREAASHGLNYVTMDGNIGCLVNGAGLAMATMDIVKQAGGQPANFLDVGGGATKEMVTAAFKILCRNSGVKAILINIFGGILRCDLLAQGIVEAVREVQVKVPVVVRLEGNQNEKGREILGSSGLKILPAKDMGEAAKKAVEAAGLTR